LERRGLVSYRRLGDAAGISHETARRVILGYRTTALTISKIADAMGVQIERIHELRNEDTPEPPRAWTPPESASRLTHEEREALSRLISLMTLGRREDGEGDAEQPTPKTPGPSSPAPTVEHLDARRRRAETRADEATATPERHAAQPMPEGGTRYQQLTREQDEAAERPDPS